MDIATFVADYIPPQLRRTRDFTGDRGWCHLANQILRRMAAEGLIDLNQQKEVPVIPFAGAGTSELRYITLPTDFLRVIDIYEYGQEYTHYLHELIDGKIKLAEEYDDTTAIVTAVEVKNTAAPTTTDCYIAQTTGLALANDDCKDLLVTFTNPAGLVGQYRLVTASEYAAGTATHHLHWTTALTVAPTVAVSNAALYDTFLMLKYFAAFTVLTASSDEIPIDAQFEIPLGFGMSFLAAMGSDTEVVARYKSLYDEELRLLRKTVFTPTEEQARPVAREWPTFEDEHGAEGGGYTNVQTAGDEL